MPGVGFVLLAVLIIAIAGSTRAQRSEARERLRRWTPLIWLVNAALVAAIVIPELM